MIVSPWFRIGEMLRNAALLLYIALVWASAILFIKNEESTVPPITIMAGRALIAFVTLFAAALITRRKITGLAGYFPKFVFFALLGIVLVWLFLAFGQEYISVGLASVLVTTTPLMTFVILVLILRAERFSLQGLGGLVMGFAGIVLVIGLNRIMSGGTTLTGVMYIGGAFMLLAVNGILVAKWMRGVDPLINTMYFLLFGGLILAALAFVFERPLQVPWTRDTIASELALGVICTASGYFGYYYLIQKAGAYFSSFIFYFIPVFGMMEGHMFRGEKVAVSQIVGVAVVLAGVYLINREKG